MKYPPGFMELWQLARAANSFGPAHDEWVISELKNALRCSLQFADTIYSNWRSCEFEKPKYTPHIRAAVVRTAHDLFRGNSDCLLRVLSETIASSESEYAVCRFLMDFNTPGRGAGDRPQSWKWFARELLTVAEKDPDVVVPSLAVLVTSLEQREMTNVFRISENVLNGLFANMHHRLAYVFIRYPREKWPAHEDGIKRMTVCAEWACNAAKPLLPEQRPISSHEVSNASCVSSIAAVIE
jgi:hypothetical protein